MMLPSGLILAVELHFMYSSYQEQLVIFLPNRETLILRALEQLFDDQSVLVKRQLLDILILHLPLNSHIFTFSQKVRKWAI